jgi:hypothetical protein
VVRLAANGVLGLCRPSRPKDGSAMVRAARTTATSGPERNLNLAKGRNLGVKERRSALHTPARCGGSGGSRLATGRLFLHKFSPPGFSQS